MGSLKMALAVIVLSCAPAVGGVLYTTLPVVPNQSYPAANDEYGTSFYEAVAAPFSLAAPVTVTDALLALGYADGTNDTLNVYIADDNSGIPGASRVALQQVGTVPFYSDWFSVPPPDPVQFTCSGSGCNLDAATTYWLVAEEPSDASEQDWLFGVNTSTMLIAYNLQAGFPAGAWQHPLVHGGPAFQIDGGTSVPEPGSPALLGWGLLGLIGVSRRRFNF